MRPRYWRHPIAASASAADPPILGVDVGGTFTDFVSLDAGRLRIHKLLSNRADPALAPCWRASTRSAWRPERRSLTARRSRPTPSWSIEAPGSR